MEQLGSILANFLETLRLSIFLKSVAEIQVPLKFDRNDWSFKRTPMYIFNNISLGSLRMRNVLVKFVDKIKTHILSPIFFFENLPFYEIMCKNIVQLDT